MPRANRHFVPGYVRHITHRRHQKTFLLKFAGDRRRLQKHLRRRRKRLRNHRREKILFPLRV